MNEQDAILAAAPRNVDDPTRQRILHAAKANLRRFGADKTTVVDIARDLGMSHSNVYRFFRTKAELLDAIVDEWLAEEAALRDRLVTQPGPTGERLERLLLALLARKRAKLTDDAELSALYQRVLDERPDSGQRLETITRAAFERIIADGVGSGELADVDVPAAARVIKYAVAAFFSPAFVRQMLVDPATTEGVVRDLLRTIVAGFANRDTPPRLGDEHTA